jgi:hypothetical protein
MVRFQHPRCDGKNWAGVGGPEAYLATGVAGGEADRGGGSAGAADELLTSSLMAVALGPDAGSFQSGEVRYDRVGVELSGSE